MTVYETICRVIHETLGVDPANEWVLDSRLEHLADSLDCVELSFALGEALGCSSRDLDVCILSPERTLRQMIETVEASALNQMASTLRW